MLLWLLELGIDLLKQIVLSVDLGVEDLLAALHGEQLHLEVFAKFLDLGDVVLDLSVGHFRHQSGAEVGDDWVDVQEEEVAELLDLFCESRRCHVHSVVGLEALKLGFVDVCFVGSSHFVESVGHHGDDHVENDQQLDYCTNNKDNPVHYVIQSISTFLEKVVDSEVSEGESVGFYEHVPKTDVVSFLENTVIVHNEEHQRLSKDEDEQTGRQGQSRLDDVDEAANKRRPEVEDVDVVHHHNVKLEYARNEQNPNN